ncbi:immunoglobulin-like domain-containing protein [Paenibacillus rigui]|nr:immunoglobulin-like domain-containing protein [Paenibacillus rigui]
MNRSSSKLTLHWFVIFSLVFGCLTTLAIPAPAASAAVADTDLLLHYDMMHMEGTRVKDQTGRFDGTWVNPQNAEWIQGSEAGAIGFTGDKSATSYIQLPEGILNGLTDITVSAMVNWKGTSAAEWLYALGQSDTKYMYFTPKYNADSSARFGIATNGWRNEVSAKASTLASNNWKLITTVLSGTDGTLTLYIDGAVAATGSTNGFTLDQIRNTSGPSGYIGKSMYTADPYFGGMVGDFKIYKRALSASEISGLQSELAQRNWKGLMVDYSANALDYSDFIGSNPGKEKISTNLQLPSSGKYGTTITWESQNQQVLTNDGVVNRPPADSGNQDVILIASITDGTTVVKKSFTVTVLRKLSAMESVTADAQALKVNNIGDVRGNLTLPVKGENGSTITWLSDNASVVSPSGEVHRPAHGSGDTTVKLTAKLSSDGGVLTKGFLAQVKELPAPQDYAGYVFSYFTGEGTSTGEQIYFALSQGNDPLHWQELNGGKPALTSHMGEKGLRDPFIIRSPEGDRFYLIATDLKMYGSGNWDAAQRTGSRSIMVWESKDLIHWSDQRMVQISPSSAGNTWAPEAYYDKTTGEYVVFWASKIYDNEAHTGSTYQKMMYTKTRDFYTFTEPAVYIDRGYSIIDTTMTGYGGQIFRITKDERSNTTSTPNGKFVFEEKGASIFDPNFTMVKEGIGKGSISQGEGPTIFKSNTENKWYLFIDEFGGRGYVPFETTDLSAGNWTLSSNYSLPSRPRHGTVLPVTQAEYDELLVQVPAVQQPSTDVRVTGIALESPAQALQPGMQAQLQAAVSPADAANKAVVWSSSREDVAKVDETGKVTALNEGTSYVTAATVDGGYLAVAEVKVSASGETGHASASFSGDSLVTAGQPFDVIYSLSGLSANTLAQDVTFTYDPSHLEWISAGSARDGVQIVHQKAAAGEVRLLAVYLGTASNGPSFKLSFRAKERLETVPSAIAAVNITVADASGKETGVQRAEHSFAIHGSGREALESLIAGAQAKHDAAVEGIRTGQYPKGSKAVLQSAINSAKSVAASPAATAEQIAQAIQQLNAAVQTFADSVNKHLQGDLNNDDKLSVGDLAVIAQNYGKTRQDADWASAQACDLNRDGKVDIEDLVAIANHILEPE